MLARLLESWDDPAVWTSTRSIEERRVNVKPTVHASLDAPWRPDDVTEALDSLGILRSASYVRMIRIGCEQEDGAVVVPWLVGCDDEQSLRSAIACPQWPYPSRNASGGDAGGT